MILEFILAHAGIFTLGLYKRRTPVAMLVLALFYGVFIAGFGFAFKQFEVAAGAGALLLGRMLMVAFAPQRPIDLYVLRAFFTLVLYLFCMFLADVVFSTGWRGETKAGVELIVGRNPFMGLAVVAGSLYFFALAMLETWFFFRGDRLVERLRARKG